MREREERLTVPHELSGRQIKNKPTNGTKINIKKRKSCHLQHNKTIAAPQLLFVAKLSFVYHRRIKLNQTVDKRKDRLITTKQQTSQISTGKQTHQRKKQCLSACRGREREKYLRSESPFPSSLPDESLCTTQPCQWFHWWLASWYQIYSTKLRWRLPPSRLVRTFSFTTLFFLIFCHGTMRR